MSSPGLFQTGPQSNPATGREEPLDRWLDRLCQGAMRDMSASGAAVALRTGDTIICRASAGDAPEVGVPVDLEHGLCARCLRTGALVVEQQLDSAIASVVASPVLRGTEAIGFFAVFAIRKSAFLPEHITTVQHSAAEIAARVEREADPTLSALRELLKDDNPALDLPNETAILDIPDQGPALGSRKEPSVLDFPSPTETKSSAFAQPVHETSPAENSDPLSLGFDTARLETSAAEPFKREPRAPARSAAMELDELLAAAGFGAPRTDQKAPKGKDKKKGKVAEKPAVAPGPEVLPLAADVPEGDEIMKIVREMDREVSRRSGTATAWDPVDPAPREPRRNRKLLAAVLIAACVTVAGGVVVTRSFTTNTDTKPATTTQGQPSRPFDSAPATVPVSSVTTSPIESKRESGEAERTPTPSQPATTTKTADEPIPVMPGYNPDLRRAGEAEPEPTAPVAIVADALTAPVIPSGSPAVPTLVAPSQPKPIPPAQLVSQVTPVFPPVARTMKVSGKVVASLTVRPDGSVSKATVLSGNPIFHDAVLAAVKRWRYSPLPSDVRQVERVAEVTISFNK